MTKAFEVKYKVSSFNGKELGTNTVRRATSKTINNKQLAARDVAWHLKMAGLKADIVSVKPATKADKFKPVRVTIGANGRQPKTAAATA
jgi:hypothetical protein